MKERVIEQHLRKVVKALGGETRKVRWIGRRGCPDRMVLFPHRQWWAWVELKSPTGKLRPEQVREIDRLDAVGHRILVFCSKQSIDSYFSTFNSMRL